MDFLAAAEARISPVHQPDLKKTRSFPLPIILIAAEMQGGRYRATSQLDGDGRDVFHPCITVYPREQRFGALEAFALSIAREFRDVSRSRYSVRGTQRMKLSGKNSNRIPGCVD